MQFMSSCVWYFMEHSQIERKNCYILHNICAMLLCCNIIAMSLLCVCVFSAFSFFAHRQTNMKNVGFLPLNSLGMGVRTHVHAIFTCVTLIWSRMGMLYVHGIVYNSTFKCRHFIISNVIYITNLNIIVIDWRLCLACKRMR